MSSHMSNEQLREDFPEYMEYKFPKITIVIPTYNNSQNIDYTLDKILTQVYPDLEVIIVDAGSTDRTLEIISSLADDRIRMCSAASFDIYEMMNKGISLAKGEYINFLAPGDFYISTTSLKSLMLLGFEKENMHLLYGACLLRDGKSEPRILYRHLSANLLKRGMQPTSIQSCLFHKDLFSIIGKFSTHFKLRGEFDLFCRFILSPGLVCSSTNSVLIDFDLKPLYRKHVWIHFKETFAIIRFHFGIFTALKWLFYQKDFRRLARLWRHSIKTAFIRK